MKFLRMPNKAQSLKQALSKLPNQNKENTVPFQSTKSLTKAQSLYVSMEVEEPKKVLKEEEIYEKDILDFLIRSARKSPQQYNYIQRQPDISEHMRMILISWLIDVHLKYKLNPQTLFITVDIIDSYLSAENVCRKELQLLGVTALWIAAKYQQTYQVPKISNLLYICNSIYTDSQILEMESRIMLRIKFDLLKITSFTYYQTLKKYTLLKQKDYFFGRYLLEGMMFDLSTKKYTQLTITASVIFLIQKFRGYQSTKQQKISQITGVTEKQIRICARQIGVVWKKMNQSSQMSSLRKKFMKPEFLEVAEIRLHEKTQKAMR